MRKVLSVLDFRRGQSGRAGLSGGDKRRLLLLVFLLGTVVWLMGEARKPENYRWLWLMFEARQQSEQTGEAEPIDTRISEAAVLDPAQLDRFESPSRDQTARPSAPPQPAEDGAAASQARVTEADEAGPSLPEDAPQTVQDQADTRPESNAETASAEPSAESAGDRAGGTGEDRHRSDPAALRKRLERIDYSGVVDDAPFRLVENDAWFAVLDTLRQFDGEAIQQASPRPVGFSELFRLSDQYRGRLVSLEGTLVRAHRVPAAPNDVGIRQYYQLWLRPRYEDNPVVIYSLNLPEGFPTGMRIDEPITLEGVFFKRWAYSARDGVRIAPVVLARSVHWERLAMTEESTGVRPPMIAIVLVALAIAGAIVAYVYARTERPRAEKDQRATTDRRTSQGSESGRPDGGGGPSTFDAFSLLLAVGIAIACVVDSPALYGEQTPEVGEPVNATSTANADDQRTDPITNAREFLEAYGVTESYWARAVDGRAIEEGERELLFQLLYRAGQIRPEEAYRWREASFDYDAVRQSPNDARGRLFRIRCRVEQVERLIPAEEIQARMGLPAFYRCRLVDGDNRALAVYARQIPQAWSLDHPPEGRAQVDGLFFKWSASDSGKPLPVFVADRVGWLPPGLLGQLGMDVSLFDHLEEVDDTPAGRLAKHFLTERDRECFYELMAAVERAPEGELNARALKRLQEQGLTRSPVAPLFNRPEESRGKLVRLVGTARRVEKVPVNDPDIQDRFGIDHYYTIYLFTDDSQNYPLVVCTRHIPNELPLGEGAGYRENVSAAGFFFKSWAYQPIHVLDPDREEVTWQLSPLIIAREVQRHGESGPVAGFQWAYLLPGGLVVLVFGVWLAVWWMNRSERKRPLLREGTETLEEPLASDGQNSRQR